MTGPVRLPRRPPGWVAPGPAPTGEGTVMPGEDEDVCFLSGDWRLFQKQAGHRWSLDDLVTAHFALADGRSPAEHLDLGCGIGSVLLLLAWQHPNAVSTGIEAQAVSAALARKSIEWNGVGWRVTLIEADFRDVELAPRFDLVTGTPPYFPLGTGTLSQKVQAAPCRFETRGGVEAYCSAAARALTHDGAFVFCEGAGQHARVEAALAEAGLCLWRWQDVVPREGKGPLLTRFAAGRARRVVAALPPLVVRAEDGQWTAPFLAIRGAMGMPPRP